MTITAHPRTCRGCQHTELIKNVSAGFDPDRLADHVRAELTRCVPDEDDADMLYLGRHREFAVDIAEHEVWEGEYTRTPEQQLHLALVHLAAALAAGAKL